MEYLYAMAVGLIAGLHTSTWGMYKDSPHEGFTWPKYFRSTIAGVFYGALLHYFLKFDLPSPRSIVLLFGCVYIAERLTMEVYKTFLRQEDQSKYFIPMQLSVFGKPIESRSTRYLAAVVYVGIIALIGYGIVQMNASYQAGRLNWPWPLILLVCSVGGWISAFGGAWKDAPLEGFETFKFFRSPGVAYFYAWVTSLLTDNLIIITMCSIGFTIASIETYKTFYESDKPRGKFAGKPILFPEMLTKRKPFRFLFFGIWAIVISSFILAVS